METRHILGYHGTSTIYVDAHKRDGIPPTHFPGDWLGHGTYFWEGDFERAAKWATEWVVDHHGGEPAVWAAMIDLSDCFDLTLMAHREVLQSIGTKMCEHMSDEERNKLKQNDKWRGLDCLAINAVVGKWRMGDGRPKYSCVRGAFQEGEPLYEATPAARSAIRGLDHIQINVLDRRAILQMELITI